jgi:hypothetical protein
MCNIASFARHRSTSFGCVCLFPRGGNAEGGVVAYGRSFQKEVLSINICVAIVPSSPPPLEALLHHTKKRQRRPAQLTAEYSLVRPKRTPRRILRAAPLPTSHCTMRQQREFQPASPSEAGQRRVSFLHRNPFRFSCLAFLKSPLLSFPPPGKPSAVIHSNNATIQSAQPTTYHLQKNIITR